MDKCDVVIEFVCHHWDIAITVEEVGDAANNNNCHKSTDGEDAANAGVGVVWEKIIPLVKNIAQAVGDKDGEWEQN